VDARCMQGHSRILRKLYYLGASLVAHVSTTHDLGQLGFDTDDYLPLALYNQDINYIRQCTM